MAYLVGGFKDLLNIFHDFFGLKPPTRDRMTIWQCMVGAEAGSSQSEQTPVGVSQKTRHLVTGLI